MSVNICKFPSALKKAEICPIYKKVIISMYQITDQSVLECVMVNQLSNYFSRIFNPILSGFRKQHSCETVLLRVIENIKLSLEKGQIVIMILMDLHLYLVPLIVYHTKYLFQNVGLMDCQ